MESIRYYIFAIRWLWRNRTWGETRQKYKALNRDWKAHEIAREVKRNHG